MRDLPDHRAAHRPAGDIIQADGPHGAAEPRPPSIDPSIDPSTHPTIPHTPRWAAGLAVFLGWFFAGAGVMRLLPVPFDMDLFASWGLPMWFRAGVGLAELLVGVLALRARTRPVGLVGIGVVMVSAGTMHAALGHSLLVAFLVNGTLAAAAFVTAWMTRWDVLR
jgi:hypothetical protein